MLHFERKTSYAFPNMLDFPVTSICTSFFQGQMILELTQT
jgi:hypothetical protein